MIAIYFIIAAAVFALGCWQGYAISRDHYDREIQELKKQPVNVKAIRPKVVPLSVKKYISDTELHYGGMDALALLEKEMVRELAEGLRPYLIPYSHEDKLTRMFEVKKTLLVVEPEKGVHYE